MNAVLICSSLAEIESVFAGNSKGFFSPPFRQSSSDVLWFLSSHFESVCSAIHERDLCSLFLSKLGALRLVKRGWVEAAVTED